jgi:tetratricopeptide (TPR) repeat protein
VTDLAKDREDDLAIECCKALGISLYQLRSYDEALPYARRAADISAELYGPEDRRTLKLRSNVAVLFKVMGDLDAALAIYDEVLETQQRVLGSEDLDVAATINNVGALLKQRDLYHDILPLYSQALRIREDMWRNTGHDDPNRFGNAYKIAESRQNMGALLMDLGRHREARSLLEGASRIYDDELGRWHERHVSTLANLGLALRAQRDYQLSVSRLKRAVEVSKRVSGVRSLDTAGALANLGAVLKEQADEDVTLFEPEREQTRADAEARFREALEVSEQTHGNEHFLTGGILSALAGVLDPQGSSEGARRYRERAEAIRQGAFQNADTETADVLNKAGTSLREQGLYDEARIYLERVLVLREETLGEQHFNTSTSQFKVGVLYQLWGRDGQARPHLEQVLAVRERICGEGHPATELVRENLGLLGV